LQELTEGLGAHPQKGSKSTGGEGIGSISKGEQNPLPVAGGEGLGSRFGRVRTRIGNQRERGGPGDEDQGELWGRGMRPMLGGEEEGVALSPEVEARIGPGVELARAAKGLAGSQVTGAFSGVVNDGDGEMVSALEVAKKGKERHDGGGDVFIDAVQPHKGVEDQERGFELGDRPLEALTVLGAIEADRGGSERPEVEVLELEAEVSAGLLEAASQDHGSILGGEDEDAAGGVDREAAETGSARSDRDGETEGEEGLSALGLAAEDADGFFAPEALDEPARRCRVAGDLVGGHDGEGAAHELTFGGLGGFGRPGGG
jgi:hypothetical protein